MLIAAPLLLVGGSWQEITAGPTAADVAAPSDPAGSADSERTDDAATLQEDPEPAAEADPGADPVETTPAQPSSTQGGGAEDDVP